MLFGVELCVVGLVAMSSSKSMYTDESSIFFDVSLSGKVWHNCWNLFRNVMFKL